MILPLIEYSPTLLTKYSLLYPELIKYSSNSFIFISSLTLNLILDLIHFSLGICFLITPVRLVITICLLPSSRFFIVKFLSNLNSIDETNSSEVINSSEG